MNKIKIILSFVFVIALSNSCSSDLELTNPNQLSPESFFKSEAQVQSAVNTVYVNLQTQGLYARHMFFMMDNMSHENAGNAQLEADKRQYLDFAFDSSHGAIGLYWDACFRGIAKCNFVIGNQEAINEIPDAFMSAANKAKAIGEAKFMRAFFNFLLVTRYGGVPLITDIPTAGDGLPRASAADVYAQIVTDLRDASGSLLPKAEEEQGRATKEAAIAMLGKVLLFSGDKSGALTEFKKLNTLSLEADYFDNFTEEGEHGPESIFEIEFNDDLGAGSKWGTDGSGPNEVTFRGQEYGMLNWFNVYPSDDLLDEYEDGDNRYQGNFYSEGDPYLNGTEVINVGNLTAGGEVRRAGWKKYQNYYKDASEDQDSGINFKYLRYADVLLMMAECESDPATAAGYINQVRSRAGLPNTTASTASEIFDAIVHERKVEFAGEQIRFNDIMRWGNASTELAGTNFQAGKHEFFPIPDNEISSNESITAADQNPGY